MIFTRKELDLPCFSEFDAEFFAFSVEFSTNATVSCICCMSDTAQFIQDSWLNVVNEVNHDYITTEISTFERWNIYLVFVCKEQLDTETQYKLENDKYAMRKLYIKFPDEVQPDQTEQVLCNLLSTKLLLADVDIKLPQEAADSLFRNLSSVSHRVCELKLSNSRARDEVNKRDRWLKEELKRRLDNED